MALHLAWGTFQGLTCLSKFQDALIFKSLEKSLIVFHQLGGMAEVLWLLEIVFFFISKMKKKTNWPHSTGLQGELREAICINLFTNQVIANYYLVLLSLFLEH